MLHFSARTTVVRQDACAFLLVATLCMAITACGGADEQRSNEASARFRAFAANKSPSFSAGAATAGVDTGSPPPTTPPPRLPSEGEQLRDEIERLEQQGVLPTLERGTDIVGPDANHNGVRDDIDAYIAAQPLTDLQRKAAQQRARVQQAKLLVDTSDKSAVAALSERSMAATNCIVDRFEGDEAHAAHDLSLRIEAITANTPERAKRYMGYLAALSGTSVVAPDGDTCEL